MKLSRTMAYGVHAIVQLARSVPGVPVPCSKLARDGKMPERFLVQILRLLVNRGLLRSSCGAAGGYSLSRSPEEISLLDIVEAFDDFLCVDLPALECMAQGVRSRVAETLHDVAASARFELRKLSVADLIGFDTRPEPNAAGARRLPVVTFALVDTNEYNAQAGDSAFIR